MTSVESLFSRKRDVYRSLLFIIILFFSLNAFSKDYPPCGAGLPIGTECIGSIQKTHPTQPEVGFLEVKEKLKRFEKLKEEGKLEEAKIKKIAPVIVGPDREYYLIDHHHTLLALEKLGETEVYLKIVDDWSHLDRKSFWQKMKDKNFCFLERADGSTVNPLDMEFPTHLKECKNNPYRSLVSMLIEKKLVSEVSIPYFEFYVGSILRRLGLQVDEDHYKRAIKDAKKIIDTKKFEEEFKKIKNRNCSIKFS